MSEAIKISRFLFGVCDPRRETGVITSGFLAWLSVFAWIMVPLFIDGEVAVNPCLVIGEYLVRLFFLSQVFHPSFLMFVSLWLNPSRIQRGRNWKKMYGKKRSGRWRRDRRYRHVCGSDARKKSPSSLSSLFSSVCYFNTGWESEPTEEELMADSFLPIGYADEFDDLCARVPDFDLLLRGLSSTSLLSMHQGDPNSFFGLVSERVTPERLEETVRIKGFYVSSKRDAKPIIFDSGASMSVSMDESDFIGKILPTNDSLGELTSDGSNSSMGVGKVRWMVRDAFGREKFIETAAYYVPQARVRLFSPQTFFQEYFDSTGKDSGEYVLTRTGSKFVFPDDGTVIRFRFQKSSNLPVVELSEYDGSKPKEAFVVEGSNRNLTMAQKELLKWHFKIGHFNLQWIQKLMRRGPNGEEPIIPTKISQSASCERPLCSACQFGKMTRRGAGSMDFKVKKGKEMSLKRDQLVPGQVISVDQYESKVKGRLLTSRGKERPHEMYCGGTIFVDHASGYMYVGNQPTLRAGDTVRSKREFETIAREHNVLVREYHGDNGVFKTDMFKKDCEDRNQKLDFSGVGAHHQNGVAERAIRTVVESARTMMLHAAIYWPDEADLLLWPMALEYAVHLWNHTPGRESGVAPLELFSGTKVDSAVLRNSHVWGCPAYVLDPTLQDGKKLPKWKPRSRRGQFVGFSRQHASTVGLIRNLRTGSISPQFHVVFDDFFTTIPTQGGLDDYNVPENWGDLFRFSRLNVLEDWTEIDGKAPTLSLEWRAVEETQNPPPPKYSIGPDARSNE